MPDTFTADKIGARLQETGGNENTWGNYLNDEAITFLAAAIGDYRTKSVAGSANVTLTAAEARSAVIVLTGVLTGSINVIVPTSEGGYLIVNNTTGAFTITVKTTAGTGITIPRGTPELLWCDGTNVVDLGGDRLPQDNISGLTLTNAADTDHDITVAAGSARDATNAVNMVLTSAITKQIDAAWAVGSAQGGLDTGAVGNDTLYAVWLIKRSDTGVVDMLFSASFTAPTMPASYDYKRLIGAVRSNNAANLYQFIQAGDFFQFLSYTSEDIDDNTITAGSWETATVPCPPYCAALFEIIAIDSGGNVDFSVGLRTKGSTAANFSQHVQALTGLTPSAVNMAVGPVVIGVNADRQVEYAMGAETSVGRVVARVKGFFMTTRSSPR